MPPYSAQAIAVDFLILFGFAGCVVMALALVKRGLEWNVERKAKQLERDLTIADLKNTVDQLRQTFCDFQVMIQEQNKSVGNLNEGVAGLVDVITKRFPTRQGS